MPGCSLISATVGAPPLLVLCDQLLDELPPPFLGALELVEGIDVKARDAGTGVGDRGGEVTHQAAGRVAARQGKAPYPSAVRPEEARRLAQTDLPRDLEKPAIVHGSRNSDPDRKEGAAVTNAPNP